MAEVNTANLAQRTLLLRNLPILLALYFSMLGSFFYVYSESYALGFVLLPILVVYVLLFWLNNGVKISYLELNFLLFWLLFFSGALIAQVFAANDDNLRVIKFLLYLLVIFFTCSVIQKKSQVNLLNIVILWSLITIFIICLLQISYHLTGIGIEPAYKRIALVTGPYGNPNDLSIIGLVVFLYAVYRTPKYSKIIISLSSILVVVSASRLAIIVWFVVCVLNLGRVRLRFKILLIFIVPCCFWLLDLELLSYAMARIMSIPQHFDYSHAKTSSSSFVRFGSYLYFVTHIFDIGVGSLTFKDYSYFYRNSIFEGSLIAANPHNFFIELCLLYGWLGLLACALFIVWLLQSVKRSYKRNHILLALFLVAAICVPSSIINFLPLWCVLICCLASNKRLID